MTDCWFPRRFGDRHVRVLNFQMRVVNQLSDVFRHAELDAILNYMAKQACAILKHKPSKQVKVGRPKTVSFHEHFLLNV